MLEEGTGAPIAGARVHVQADPSSPVAVTAGDGSFTLPVSPAGMVMVTAGLEYDRTAAANFATGGVMASDGQTGVTISLLRLPAADDPTYQSFLPQVADCGNCHEEQEAEWRLSNHASAGGDAWVRDLFSGDGTPGGGAGYVFRDTHDPGETGFCATCHTPMADVFDPGNVMLNEVTSAAALEGISCIACHQMDSVNDDVQALHHLGNSTYRFPDGRPFIPTQEFVWGPLDDITFGGMKASYAPLFSDSLLCASCHEYNRPGTAIPGQTTYTEWLASPYAVPGTGFRSCQDCHMPEAGAPGYLVDPIGDPPLRPGEQIHEHEFVGRDAGRARGVHPPGDDALPRSDPGSPFAARSPTRPATPFRPESRPAMPWWSSRRPGTGCRCTRPADARYRSRAATTCPASRTGTMPACLAPVLRV